MAVGIRAVMAGRFLFGFLEGRIDSSNEVG